MKFIKKITIRRYRSFGNIDIDTEELNIYSGANNVGKSNVLKALNLFFNYETQLYNYDKDYNKAYTEGATGARSVTITVHFCAQGGTGMLQKDFEIEREFPFGTSTPVTRYRSYDPELQKKIDQKNNGVYIGQFNKFLNTVNYYYIPAVRDREFTKRFLTNFETIIKQSANGGEFKNKIDALSEILSQKSKDLSKDFEKFLKLPTSAKLSSKIEDILGAIEIQVKSGIKVAKKKNSKKEAARIIEKDIDIFSSGDGILMSYLVYFLNYLCRNDSKQKFIWGYEEPENSLEYSKVQELASKFYEEFLNNAQIFITTHSPAFVNLRNRDRVSLHRVYTEYNTSADGSDKRLSKISSLDEISKKLDSLQDRQSPEYIKLEKELYMVEFAQEIERATKDLEDKRKTEEEQIKILRLELEKAFPGKVFICEDEKCVKLWEILLNDNSINVKASCGCGINKVEEAIESLYNVKNDYRPKVFRTVDRDGYTDRQIAFIEGKLNKNYSFSYKYKILPVYEIENFTIIDNPKATDSIFLQKREEIKSEFFRTAENHLATLRKEYPAETELFGKNNQYCSCINNMFNEAEKKWKYLLNGKGLIDNLNYRKYILDNPPKELKDLVVEIKEFFK